MEITPTRSGSMDTLLAALRREQAVRLLLPLFFLSGATALVYQSLWVRQLNLVFGTSTFAVATVLAAFMAGLAMGGFWMARRADAVRAPLALYGWLEVGIGLYALAFPFLLNALAPVYLALWRVFEPGPLLFGTWQFVLIGLALLLPTTAMGATLPLLARFATDRLGAAGQRVGVLYGVNTAGAVFGTWLCGFILLPNAGLLWTTLLACAANLALGLAAVALSNWAGGAVRTPVERDLPPDVVPARLPLVGLVVALAGFSALVYEVAWTRVMVLMIGASVYAFSVMLMAFLSGIALGGRLGGPLADRALRRGGRSGVLAWLAALQVGVGVLSYLLLYVFPELPYAYVRVFDALGRGQEPPLLWAGSLLIAGLVMTPPAVLMGASFPMAVRAVLGDPERLGRPVGAIYAYNTLGAVLGAAMAGFVFLPLLGVKHTVMLAGAVNLASALLLLRPSVNVPAVGRRWAAAGIVAVVLPVVGWVAQPRWDPLLMTAGMYQYAGRVSDVSREGIRRFAVDRYDLLFYEEGLSSVVTVARNLRTGTTWLANNGKIEASTQVDMPTQVLVGLLPFQFVEQPQEVLVVGLASGITAGSTARVQAIEELQVVELEPAVVRAARLFDAYNHEVVDDPRTQVIINDGRNHVLLQPPERYDVVVSEPSNPWISGVSNLFTREFFELGKSRLKPGGVWTQWVQLYGMSEEDVRSLLGTFADVFPHVHLYATIQDADLVMVGSDQPLPLGVDVVEDLHGREPLVVEELERVDMERPMDLLAAWVMDREGILRWAEGVGRNTDDNMRIEYSAPRHLHRRTSVTNMRALLRHAQVPVEALGGEPEELAELARAYIRRDDMDRSLTAMASALEVLSGGDRQATELVEHVADLDRLDGLRRLGALMHRLEDEASPEMWAHWEQWTAELAAWHAADLE